MVGAQVVSAGRAGRSPGARVVFVHGIGAKPDVEESRRRWTEALARGAVRAGHGGIAAALEDEASVEVVFAHYGDLFQTPGAQGGAGERPSPDEVLLLRDLLLEIVDLQLAEAKAETNADETEQLRHVRAQLVTDSVAQGAGNVGRQVLNAATALLAFRPLRRAGQWAGAKLLIRDLSQVARYLSRGEPDADGRGIDQRIRARILEAIGDRPAVVVAHSLGSVVALESLHDPAFRAQVPLLVTIGSPLALRTVVWPRLRPRPPRTPDCVERWLNFWDRDDLIVARPWLEEVFGANAHGVTAQSDRIDSDGIWVHTATKYLDKPGVAGPICEALAKLGGPPPT
jgi:pimeloyl-ACP methyl ester carboxylesterase